MFYISPIIYTGLANDPISLKASRMHKKCSYIWLCKFPNLEPAVLGIWILCKKKRRDLESCTQLLGGVGPLDKRPFPKI